MSHPKILVIDDEVNIASFIKDFLEEEGFHVITAHTGKDGLEKASQELPNVILLDVQLPDMNGYTVCEGLRKHIHLRNTPIVMLTARTGQHDELVGLKAGADDYLTKPINTARLLARINAVILRNIRELDANPLTHLPGNSSIAQEIEDRIRGNKPYAIIYMDLNNFKAFNDKYGFIRGDEAIKLTAKIITAAFDQNKHPEEFVGHIGGDDFVCTAAPERAKEICEDIISNFDKSIPTLYDEAARKQGYVIAKNRQGETTKLPLMGISIVVVTNKNRSFSHPGEISTVASELKSWAKSHQKSIYVTDRRKEGNEA